MMMTIAEFAAWSWLAFWLALFAAQIAAKELGYWFGRRDGSRAESHAQQVGVVVGAMLGLLAFVLALTLSFANTRFSERRAGTLAEANAIGTAWLRAEAIGHPRATVIARLLEEYTQVRGDFVRAGLDPAVTAGLQQRTTVLQNTIWGHAAAIARERPDPIVASFMASLNETFDMSTAERFAFSFTLPPQLFWLLIGLVLIAMAGLGYQFGLRGVPLRMLAALLTAMWTMLITDILDLSAARVGSFRTSAAIYDWTLQGFQGGVTIPPAPAAR